MKRPAYILRSLRRIHLFPAFPVMLLIALSLSIVPAGIAQDDLDVDDFGDVQRIRALADACPNLETNTLCYAGGTVEVITDGTTTPLSETGARLPLDGVQRIETAVDPQTCDWGGIIMRLPGTATASQPDITFVALGNVVLENAVAPEDYFVPAAPLSITINTDNVNFRAAPGLDTDVIGRLDNGDLVNADALSPDGQWVRVEADGTVGWVFRELTQSDTDLSSLPALGTDSRGWLQAFTLRTAPAPNCPSVLPSLLLIQTPDGLHTPISVNGVNLSVGSTIVLNTPDASAFALGGPDTVDPSAAALGGPDTLDPSTAALGGPDTKSAAFTQFVVLDGGITLPDWKADGTSVVYLKNDETVAQGEALIPDSDDSADAFVLPEGTSLSLPTGPIIAANLSVVAATISLVIDSMQPDDTTTTIDSTATAPDDAPEVTLQLSDDALLAGQLLPVQLLGAVLQGGKPKLHFDLPDYMDNWLDIETHEPPGMYCDDFEVISPKAGTIILPPDSDLTFTYPSQAMFNWSMYYQMPESVRLGLVTTFHLARPSGSELKVPTSQEYVFPSNDFALQNTSLLDPQSITYNYYQLQGMGLIIPNATSGQLLWWVENTLMYIGFEDDSSLPVGKVATCITNLNLLNWRNTEAVEQPADVTDIDVSIQPVDPVGTPVILPLVPEQPTPVPSEPTQPPPSDRDGDGTPDATDRCPAEAGPASNGGCPEPPPSDRDGDGIPDNQDRCPDQSGPASNNGCPVRRG